jgi:hypothetical protein
VQKAVALKANVDERGLHPGEHVVDDTLVDVADDRARSLALYIELGDLEAVRAVVDIGPTPTLGLARGSLAFEYGDAGLPSVN